MAIKAVILDCFGVLTSSVWLEFLATLPSDKKEPARALNYQVDAGQISNVEYVAQLAELSGQSTEEVAHRLIRHGDKNKPLLDFVKSLKPDHKIGLLSNVSSNWIRDTFLNADEIAIFDDTIMSFEVGLIKPSPAIFELAAKRLGCELSECVLIDDSEVNCSAARQVGMHAVQYQNFIQCKQALQALC